MPTIRLRFTSITRRYLRAFTVAAFLTFVVSGALTLGVVAVEGVVFAAIGRRRARQRRRIAHESKTPS